MTIADDKNKRLRGPRKYPILSDEQIDTLEAGVVGLRARISELEAEKLQANHALNKADLSINGLRARIATLEAQIASARAAALEEAAKELESLMDDESGAAYGLMNDDEREAVRHRNRTLLMAATCVRARALKPKGPQG